MKQPYEDITCVYDDDPMLALDGPAVAFRTALAVMTRHLKIATLVGNPSPKVARIAERIAAPALGDLVVDYKVFFRKKAPDVDQRAFGRLLVGRREWADTDEQWAAQLADEDAGLTESDRSTELAWYVQYGKQKYCRWHNAGFTVIPITTGNFARMPGVKDGTAIVMTREPLLDYLAESFFEIPDEDALRRMTGWMNNWL